MLGGATHRSCVWNGRRQRTMSPEERKMRTTDADNERIFANWCQEQWTYVEVTFSTMSKTPGNWPRDPTEIPLHIDD